MFSYGKKSTERLSTCHKDIVTILNEAILYIDISILEGARTTARQQFLFLSSPPKTKIDGIIKKSKHQPGPDGFSHAVDIIPYVKGENPFDPNPKNYARFYFMMGIIKGISEKLLEEGKISHKVRFGLDWDGDNVFTDQSFDDLPHMELVG